MKKLLILLVLAFFACETKKAENRTQLLALAALASSNSSGYKWNLPPGFPTPISPAENPMSVEKVELGRFLFYEKKLSANETQSCGSCHLQSLAFTDGKPVGIGSTGEAHPRNAQGLGNVAYFTKLTWSNPNMNTLEVQSRAPLFGINPIELGLTNDDYLQKLKADSRYKELFAKAFGSGDDKINEQNVRFAIASFQRTMISGNSPYDKFTYQNQKTALTASQIRGMNIFNGEVAECFHCHGNIFFADSVSHSNSGSKEIFYHDNGIKSTTEYNSLPDNQKGLYELTLKTSDIGKFRAPSLRNVALTYPYMHDGSIDCSPANKPSDLTQYSDACATEALGKVIDHYMSGGKNPSNKDTTFIRPFSLTSQEKTDLINFLKALTDEDFIKNPSLSNPF
jgi:cytochrome c peroxidase